MKFSDLENGMAVKFNNGAIGMVYKGFMTYDYIICNTGEYIARNGADLDDSLESLKIKEVRSVQPYCNETLLNPNKMFLLGDVVWKQPETVEMTLAEVCKALGKDIKIIK